MQRSPISTTPSRKSSMSSFRPPSFLLCPLLGLPFSHMLCFACLFSMEQKAKWSGGCNQHRSLWIWNPICSNATVGSKVWEVAGGVKNGDADLDGLGPRGNQSWQRGGMNARKCEKAVVFKILECFELRKVHDCWEFFGCFEYCAFWEWSVMNSWMFWIEGSWLLKLFFFAVENFWEYSKILYFKIWELSSLLESSPSM